VGVLSRHAVENFDDARQRGGIGVRVAVLGANADIETQEALQQ
jgi:hypothetical protein